MEIKDLEKEITTATGHIKIVVVIRLMPAAHTEIINHKNPDDQLGVEMTGQITDPILDCHLGHLQLIMSGYGRILEDQCKTRIETATDYQEVVLVVVQLVEAEVMLTHTYLHMAQMPVEEMIEGDGMIEMIVMIDGETEEAGSTTMNGERAVEMTEVGTAGPEAEVAVPIEIVVGPPWKGIAMYIDVSTLCEAIVVIWSL